MKIEAQHIEPPIGYKIASREAIVAGLSRGLQPVPVRLHRSRLKGAKLISPNGLPIVCVTRPGKWGNPFLVGAFMKWGNYDAKKRVGFPYWIGIDREYCFQNGFTLIDCKEKSVALYRELLIRTGRDLSALRGKNLACWCQIGCVCHADVLLELANAPEVAS